MAEESIRVRCLRFVEENPGLTATMIAKELCVLLSSLSSILLALCEEGELRRQGGVGPRGGFGYFPKVLPRSKANDKTAWQHILEGDD